jgi:hypothetical protein
MTSEERKAITRSANEWSRGRSRSERYLISRAISHQRELDKVGIGEEELTTLLRERGYNPVPQLAVWKYNIDIAMPPIAVEVERYDSNPLGRTAFRAKLIDLLDMGWFVLVVWIRPRLKELPSIGAVNYTIALSETLDGQPTSVSQYRVIRSCGELVSAGCLDSDELTTIDPLIGPIHM